MRALLLLLFVIVGAQSELTGEETTEPVKEKPIVRKGMVLEIMKSKKVYSAMKYLWHNYELRREEDMSIKERRVEFNRAAAYMVRYCRLPSKKRCFDTVYLLDTDSHLSFNKFITAVMIRPLAKDEDLRHGIIEYEHGFQFVFQNRTCLYRSYIAVEGSDEEQVDFNVWDNCQDWLRYGPYIDYLQEVELMDEFNENPDGYKAAGGKEALMAYLKPKKKEKPAEVAPVEEVAPVQKVATVQEVAPAQPPGEPIEAYTATPVVPSGWINSGDI